jgi:hypothetical protein
MGIQASEKRNGPEGHGAANLQHTGLLQGVAVPVSISVNSAMIGQL